jgi:acetyltransferase-like isoleucine patch superfamily enzyme
MVKQDLLMSDTGFQLLLDKILLVLRHPIGTLPVIMAFIRGCIYAAYFRIFRKNVRIKLPFYVYQSFRLFGPRIQIEGPGSVEIGRFCSVFVNMLHGLSIVTLADSARVVIGRKCDLGGLTIRCRHAVQIGDGTMTAFSLIQDCCYLNRERGGSSTAGDSAFAGAPVKVGCNVWLTSQCCVLFGSNINDDCVLSAGSLTVNTTIPAYSFVTGSPVGKAHSILQLKRFTCRKGT